MNSQSPKLKWAASSCQNFWEAKFGKCYYLSVFKYRRRFAGYASVVSSDDPYIHEEMARLELKKATLEEAQAATERALLQRLQKDARDLKIILEGGNPS